MPFAALLAILLCLGPVSASAAPRELAEPALPAEPYRYAVELPRHLKALEALVSPAAAPVTDEGATLGRVLFHDRELSRNGLVSCASCHTQAFGFDDPTRLSIGFAGKVTRRAAMTLVNARFNPRGRYFRDERAATLEEQVLEPFTDPVEMGLAPGELERRVEARPFYGPLFSAAFGDPGVTSGRIAGALAQYVRAIVSTRSRYDDERAAAAGPLEPFAGFTQAENRGKHLFFTDRAAGGAGCAACHASEAFVLVEPRNNGLPRGAAADGGLGEVTGDPGDFGRFRAASLRNVAATAPYMHDGRFATLAEVIDHYSDAIAESPGLAPELRDPQGRPARLALSSADRAALAAFLETLTDQALMEDPRFADPFVAEDR